MNSNEFVRAYYSLLQTRRNSYEQEVTAHMATLGKLGHLEAVAHFLNFNVIANECLLSGASYV